MTARKILMLGWEFPPKITGGLGVAAQGLAEAMAGSGFEVSFLLPKKHKSHVSQSVKLIDASAIKPDTDFWKKKEIVTEVFTEIELGTRLMPYLGYETFEIAKEKQRVVERLAPTEESELLANIKMTGSYETSLSAEMMKYALLAVQVAKKQKSELVHAHDWVTFRAGIFIKKMLGIPFVAHMHSTEYDRNGIHAQHYVLEEEKAGLEASAHIFCVSHQLKETIVGRYGISAEKISVVPNALHMAPAAPQPERTPKTLAFAGRLTEQKSPTTFIDLARELTSRGYDFQYLIIGDGYLRHWLEERVQSSNYSNRVHFLGFLDRTTLMKKLSEIDLLVMPSASEPFGLVALEAVLHHVPVAAASGSGISEYLPSLPQTDRWDHYSFFRMAEQLMTDIKYRKQIISRCLKEAESLTWEQGIQVIKKAYKSIQ